MKLHVVQIADWGCAKKVAGGISRVAKTNRADALRVYNSSKQDLKARGVRWTLKLMLVVTPDRMTADQWIQFIEEGDIDVERQLVREERGEPDNGC